MKDPELPVASFYVGTVEQDREVLVLVSSSLELSFLGCTHDLSFLFMYFYITQP